MCTPAQWLVGLALLHFGASNRDEIDGFGGGSSGPCSGLFCAGGGACCGLCRMCGCDGGDDDDDEAAMIASTLLKPSRSVEQQRPLTRRTLGEESTGYISMMSQGEAESSPFESADPYAQSAAASVLDRLHEMAVDMWQLDDMWQRTRKAAVGLCRTLGKLLRRTFVPQVVGIFAGAFVGLFGRQLVLPPETAPLGWVYIGISKLGAAAVPINLILLGAALSRVPERHQVPPLVGAGIIVGRMIFMPLCGLGVAKLLADSHFIHIPYVVADPFWLVVLILTATPTANNIVVMCDLAGENRRAMSAVVFYQYMAAPLLLPGVLTLFIAFICRMRRVEEGD